MSKLTPRLSLPSLAALAFLFLIPSAQSEEPDWCRPAHEAVRRIDQTCICADTLEKRAKKLNEYVQLQAVLDVLECDPDSELWFCGGLLDEDNTYISVSPLGATAAIGDTVQLIAGVYGTKCADSGNHCTCDITVADQEFENAKIGWLSGNPNVATVDQSGLVTVVGPGSVQIFVAAEIEGHPNSPLTTSATITVGGNNVDVAFVVYNGQYDYSRFPPWGWYLWTQFSDGWFAEFEKYFSYAGFDLSLITYNRHPSRCPDITWCGFDSAPCSEHTTLMPFGFETFGRMTKWRDSWSGIETVCDEDPYPVIGEREADKGSSFYSALIDTIRNSQWSADARTKAIFAFPYYPTCAFYIGGPDAYTCDAEAGTGLTLADVTSAANEEGVNLFVFNTNTERLPECGGDGCVGSNYNFCYAVKVAPRDEFIFLADSTNGEYYPVYCGNYTIDGAVKQAIADLHSRVSTP